MQVDGAANGISVIAGKKDGHAGKKGMFSALIALFAKQHGQHQQLKNQTKQNHHAGKISGITLHHITASVPTHHQKARAHARHQEDTGIAGTLIVPATLIQTTVLQASQAKTHTLENQQKKPDGILRQKHTGTDVASHKHARTARFKIVQGNISQSVSHAQNIEPKKTESQGNPVTQKELLLPEPTANHVLAGQKPDLPEGENAAKQGSRPVSHILNRPETISAQASAHKSETLGEPITNKASLPPFEASKPAIKPLADSNTGSSSSESALKTNVTPDFEPHATGTAQGIESNKTLTINPVANNLPGMNTAAFETKTGERKRDSSLASATQNTKANHAGDISSHSNALIQHFQTRQIDSIPHNLTSGDGQTGKTVDQQGLPQNNHAGVDNRFAGLIQTDLSTSRSEPQNIKPHRSFQHLHVMDVMTQIAQSAKDGHTRLDIQLEPAHLGKIHISLQTDAAKQLMVHIAAEQTVSQQVIQQNMPQLRHALEQQGLSLGQFSMSSGSQDSSGAGQQFNGKHEWGAMDGLSSGASPASVQTSTQTTSSGQGRLSIHV